MNRYFLSAFAMLISAFSLITMAQTKPEANQQYPDVVDIQVKNAGKIVSISM